jgi:hypothetical protein
MIVNSTTRLTEGMLLIGWSLNKELTFCRSVEKCTFLMIQTNHEGGVWVILKIKLRGVVLYDLAARVGPAAGEIPEIEVEVTFNP